MHTETDESSVRYLRSGVQNFIRITYYPKATQVGTTFGDVIKNIQANLMYRAGFIDTPKLQIESEAYDQSRSSTNIIIPSKISYVTLYSGASISKKHLQCSDCSYG